MSEEQVKVSKKVSKSKKSKSAQEVKEEIVNERMTNEPSTVQTSIGEFELKELAFLPFIKLARKQIEIFWTVLTQLDFSGKEMEPDQLLGILGHLSLVDDFEENMCEIIAAYTGEEDKLQFMHLTSKDMLEIVPKIVEKVDTEALRDFFTKMLPSLAQGLGKEIQTSTANKKK